jgi:2-polyprenyl-3-methyl-5-hydroxy-6-metoxy-1,4-benzoquinol methylase
VTESQEADTTGRWYTDRLVAMDEDRSLIRRIYLVTYRQHIRRLVRGRALDIGCGVGSNLRFLSSDSVGVEHNPTSVEAARARGFTAYVTDDFHAHAHEHRASFDTLLIAHVMEHMTHEDGVGLLKSYLPYLKPGGRVVILTPQDPNCENDPTHVRYVDFPAARALTDAVGLEVTQQHGYPLPLPLGRIRPGNTNEIVTVAQLRR